MIGPELLALKKRKRRRDDEIEEAEAELKKKKLDKLKSFIAFRFLASLTLEGISFLGTGPSVRVGNKHRNRTMIINWSYDLDDAMFNRQFRLCREDFFYVLFKNETGLIKNEKKAVNSSGSSVSPYIMLMITLRILAGASYLDMIHYQVHVDSVCDIVWRTVNKYMTRLTT